MFIIFYSNGVPYGKTWNEIEADTIAYQTMNIFYKKGDFLQ